MIPRRKVRLFSVYEVRTDRPRWRKLWFSPCWCMTHKPEECKATWRLDPDEV